MNSSQRARIQQLLTSICPFSAAEHFTHHHLKNKPFIFVWLQWILLNGRKFADLDVMKQVICKGTVSIQPAAKCQYSIWVDIEQSHFHFSVMTALMIIYVSCRPDQLDASAQRHKQRPAFYSITLKHPMTLMCLDQFLLSPYSHAMGINVHTRNANVATSATVA